MRLQEIIISEARYPKSPSNEALMNAEQSGLDTTNLWYHGTLRRFDGFRLPKTEGIDELGPGVYVTKKKWLANTWAREKGFILTCVVKKGPLFDFEKINDPQTFKILKDGYNKFQKERWGSKPSDDDFFKHVWDESLNQSRMANFCLSSAGYIGGFKHNSQIEGQIVVFKPEDAMIVAREKGQSYMSSS